MLKRNLSLMALFMLSLFLPFTLLADPIVVDHTCTDVSKIPDYWIEQARKMIVQYVGESHGRQVPHGLELLAAQDERFKVQIGDGENDKIDVLTDTTALRILRTQKNTYGPINGDELYWATEAARGYTEATAQDAIDKGTPLAASLWCWCWDMSSENWVHDESGAVVTYNNERNEAYINAIRRFNTNRPQTKFIYHTGVTDVQVSAGGWRSTYYNGIIRSSATTDGGILFDQADIENWNEAGTQQQTETWNDNGTMRTIYVRNHDYDETVGIQFQQGHTNDALCLKKAKAFWWMLARIAGWDGNLSSIEPIDHFNSGNLSIFPNPVSSVLIIESEINTAKLIELFTLSGIKVMQQKINPARQLIDISQIPSGMYLYKIHETNNKSKYGKLIINR
jgi:hypothetical protein